MGSTYPIEESKGKIMLIYISDSPITNVLSKAGVMSPLHLSRYFNKLFRELENHIPTNRKVSDIANMIAAKIDPVRNSAVIGSCPVHLVSALESSLLRCGVVPLHPIYNHKGEFMGFYEPKTTRVNA